MSKKVINWVILFVLAIIWGSSFILMKRGLEVFTSDEVAALRIFIAFLFLSPLLVKHCKLNLFEHWKELLAMGMLGNFIPAFLFTKAETGISSSLTGMLNSLTPLFTMLFGVMLFRTKIRMVNAVGIFIGFVGAIGLLLVGDDIDLTMNIRYAGYVVIATICYALSVNIIKRYLNEVNSVTATVMALLFIGPMAGVYLFGYTDFTHRLANDGAMKSLGYVSVLAVFGTALSVIIFNVLIRNTNALFASSVTYMIPVVAIAWGIIDGEELMLMHIFWVIFILLGVYLVNKKVSRRR